MAKFITRIELHHANYADYETLHAAMERNGFTRTILGNDGVTYKLPTAEYYCEGNYTRQAVLDSAKHAADSTRKSYAVLVSELVGCTWVGLEPA